jgi:hypothetical protein
MSDGPWRSLRLSRAWRHVARCAEMDASSSKEIASKAKSALASDFRKIPRRLLVALRRSFRESSQRSLSLDELDRQAALRPLAEGSILGALLVSHAGLVASEGLQGDGAARETMIRTLGEWNSANVLQIQEHYYREALDRCYSTPGKRIEVALTRADMRRFADELLGIEPVVKRQADYKFDGIDEGPVLVPLAQTYPDYRSHPLFTMRMERFLEALLGRPIRYEFPWLWNTKGETLRAAMECAKEPNGWRKTRSCWQGNRRASIKDSVSTKGALRQCGVCAACMLRRLSVHSAGLSETPSNYVWENLGTSSFRDGAASAFSKTLILLRQFLSNTLKSRGFLTHYAFP